MQKFREEKLANGLQVIAELNPNVHSVAIGYFVRTGARDETPDVSGVSHFLEHMAFKGTDKFTADDVNRIFDEVGAKYNASTSEDLTLFYGAILPEYMPQTFELLSNIIYPSLRQDDFDMEKNVILEEIGMYEDQPAFTLYEKSMQMHFAGHPLGQSILGTTESIGGLKSEQMRAYHREHYKAGNIVLAIAGNTDWTRILDLAKQQCSTWPSGTCDRWTEEARPTGTLKVITKHSNLQQHLMQMMPAPPAEDELRYAAELLSVVVGDETGSRLYWELVDPGDAESAELGYNEYDGSGTYLTYLCSEPDAMAENMKRIRDIYQAVNGKGVTEEELKQAKSKVASRIVLRSERPMGRLASLGSNWVYRQEYRSVEDDLKTLSSMTTDDIVRLIEVYPLGETTTATVGPLKTLSL